MYATRPATKSEMVEMRKTYPSPMGHIVDGYRIGSDGQLTCAITTMSEITALNTPGVVAIRRRMPNGKFIYRVILSH
jgi:hypothetical protein